MGSFRENVQGFVFYFLFFIYYLVLLATRHQRSRQPVRPVPTISI